MKTNIAAAGIFTLCALVAIITIVQHNSASNAVLVLKNQDPIEKIEMSVITSPVREYRRDLTISDPDTLRMLGTAFRKEMPFFTGNVAKLNDVFVILHIYKSKKEIEVDILNSIYAGWTLSVGPKVYTNKDVFELVKKYL